MTFLKVGTIFTSHKISDLRNRAPLTCLYNTIENFLLNLCQFMTFVNKIIEIMFVYQTCVNNYYLTVIDFYLMEKEKRGHLLCNLNLSILKRFEMKC